MLLDDEILYQRASEYAQARNKRVLRESSPGYGTDGTVWKTSEHTVVKAFHRKAAFLTESECYRRLRDQEISVICGLNVPILEGEDETLMVIELTFVQPPYLLDFGKAALDIPPEYMTDKKQNNSVTPLAK